MATSAVAQDIVFSGVSTTSDDYQLGVVWSGIAREAGISMTVVENGTVSGMRKAAQGEIDMVGVGAPHYLDAVGGTGKYVDDPEALRDGYKGMKAILAMPSAWRNTLPEPTRALNLLQIWKARLLALADLVAMQARLPQLCLTFTASVERSMAKQSNMALPWNKWRLAQWMQRWFGGRCLPQ